MNRNYYLLIRSIFICYVAAYIGSVFTYDSISTWYVLLQKPYFNPPNWVFGPVWTVLYTIMGYALYLVLLKKNTQKRKSAILWFALQLILNTLWSIVFFGLHLPGMACILITFLWIAIFMTIRKFGLLVPIAGQILLPYICWVTFAGILNASIVILN